jgi:ATP-dependent helicase/nuclease subunit B
LLHHVLGEFGGSDLRDSTDGLAIGAFLNEAVDRAALSLFGTRRLAPVNVQVRQLRMRLLAFAEWQAGHAAQGWRIHAAEAPAEIDLSEVQVDGRCLRIRGRLDRIDRNEHTGEWMIFDYKSSDGAKEPSQTHRRGGRWVDLQLPMYRRLSARLGVPSSAALGYIVLPKDTRKVGSLLADWNEDELRDADQVVRDTARRILEGEYWPPASDIMYADEFSWICQDKVFHRELEATAP